MATYFSFIEKALASLGFTFESSDRKFSKFLRSFTLAIIVLVSLQSLLFLLTADEFGMDLASAFTIGLYAIQGCAKVTSVLVNFDKLKKIRGSLVELIESMEVETDPENIKLLRQFRKYTKIAIITNVSCIWIFNVKPLLDIIISTLSGSEVIKKAQFAFYYPSNSFVKNHFYLFYLYETFAGHTLTIGPLAMDGFILLLTGQATILFKTVGETFRRTINEFEASNRSTIEKKLSQTIDQHNKIFSLAQELIGTYELALLVTVLLQTGTICFIAFIISVSCRFS
jgi:hypothetical protein